MRDLILQIERELLKEEEELLEKLKKKTSFPDFRRDYSSYHYIGLSVDAGDIEIKGVYTTSRLIKCADSRGNVYFEQEIPEEIPVNYLAKILDSLFERKPLLELLEILEISDWKNLSYLIHGDNIPALKIIQVVRDFLEWSIILKLLRDKTDTIIIKDGLLRNKTFKKEVDTETKRLKEDCAYAKLKKKIEELCKKNNNLLVGIAKTSKLKHLIESRFLSKLNLMSKTFVMKFSNNDEFMEQSYKYILYREGEITFGNHLFLVKFMESPKAQIATVEIPSFAEENWEGIPKSERYAYQNKAYEYIIGLVANMGLRKLPSRFTGLPKPLVKAHENAKVREIRGDILSQQLRREVLRG